MNFTTTVGIRLGMIHFGLGSLGIPGILGVGLRTLLQKPWPAEATPSAKAETLKPKEEASSSSGAATLPVSAVTLEGPPGLSAAKAKPKAKATPQPEHFAHVGCCAW